MGLRSSCCDEERRHRWPLWMVSFLLETSSSVYSLGNIYILYKVIDGKVTDVSIQNTAGKKNKIEKSSLEYLKKKLKKDTENFFHNHHRSHLSFNENIIMKTNRNVNTIQIHIVTSSEKWLVLIRALFSIIIKKSNLELFWFPDFSWDSLVDEKCIAIL